MGGLVFSQSILRAERVTLHPSWFQVVVASIVYHNTYEKLLEMEQLACKIPSESQQGFPVTAWILKMDKARKICTGW